jgi:hypothetical protein
VAFPFFEEIPGTKQWHEVTGKYYKSLQQRELFLIFTGFPIMTLSVRTRCTIAFAKLIK